MKETKVLIADDHSMFRDGLKSILEKDKNIRVVGEVEFSHEVISAIRDLSPDLVLLDITFNDGNGIEIAREIRTSGLNVKIIILTMHQKEAYIHDALLSDVDGYVLKSESSDELINAIHNVASGALYFSKQSRNKKQILENDALPEEIDKSTKTYYLSKREKEIIKLISEGFTYKKIAEKLFISQYTVINHRQNIAHKLDLKSNMSIVKFATDHNLI